MTTPVVLVIDDEASVRDLIIAILDDGGYRAIGASSGLRALSLISEVQPDLIVLDIMMPGMDGREVLERIRQTASSAEIPVVVTSAAIGFDSMSYTKTAFLAKPFDIEHLLATVSSTLAEWGAAATRGSGLKSGR